MSFFNLFGNNKRDEISPNNVITTMKDTLLSLEKREEFLESRIVEYKTEALLCVKKNKLKAIGLMKKVKMNEKQLDSIYGQKISLETNILTIENSITNNIIISAMKQGKIALEKINKTMNPDDIGELMDDITANIDMTAEVSNVLAGPIGESYDDEILLKELECDDSLLKELDEDVFLDVPSSVNDEDLLLKELEEDVPCIINEEKTVLI